MRVVSYESRLWFTAAACFVVFALLGAYVSARPPTRLDVAAGALRGEATSLAFFFTSLGRWYVLLPVSIVMLAASLVARANTLWLALLVAAQFISQGVVAVVKPAFGRARPAGWIRFPETDLSYPSGHAVTSVVFYGALLLLALRAPAPYRPLAGAAAGLLGACVLGIPWSRLALGAHYATDVLGGVLFGCGTLCALGALYLRFGPAH